MFLIRKNYPGSDRIAWWDGCQWVTNNCHAIEFKRSATALKYAMARLAHSNYSIISVSKKDPKPVPIPLADRNGESNLRTAEEPHHA